MKIGVTIQPQMGYSYDDLVTLAKAAEDAGFDRFSVSDHFFGWVEGTENLNYEAWTALALLTPQTERIHLGSMVTSQSYRNPALLAKIVANLDNASNGRIDFGIGAGWKESEYEAYGYPYPSAKTRVLQLREALQIINLLWTEERPSFEGEFYRIKETMFLPKPIQEPPIPIWIGTEKLKAPMMEETIARYGDGVDFNDSGKAKLTQKKQRVQAACEKVGRNYQDIRWSIGFSTVVIGEDEDDYEARTREVLEQEWMEKKLTNEQKKMYLERARVKEGLLAGPVDVIVEELSECKDEVEFVNIDLPFVGDLRQNGLDTIRILKERIIPKL
ncbi:MAG: TIGR03560 family F420-dependent LLM class oxidoreductase [Candidatus Thorarchaeota archaeon]